MSSINPWQYSTMLTNASKMSSLPTAAPASSKITRGHSCVLCQQRKVKCDRRQPCSNCVKARVECVASAPPAPRRRKKIPTSDLAARLQRCEDLLKKHGVKVEEEEEKKHTSHEDEVEMDMLDMEMGQLGPSMLGVPRKTHVSKPQGTLIADKGNTYYIEKSPSSSMFQEPPADQFSTLWENLRDEIQSQEPKDSFQPSSDDEVNETCLYPNAGSLLIGHSGSKPNLTSQHPQPVHIFRLWQTFLTNVNPLTKVFHAPTVQQMILDASGDLEHAPRPTEALMFSIYLLAVISMKSEDCETMFGQSQSTLLSKYSHATQHALVRAGYLKSLSLVTLQAYTLFLVSLEQAAAVCAMATLISSSFLFAFSYSC